MYYHLLLHLFTCYLRNAGCPYACVDTMYILTLSFHHFLVSVRIYRIAFYFQHAGFRFFSLIRVVIENIRIGENDFYE